ncbi:MAG: cupredoxin domain-containing protein [Alphaproteobacteria bacterium]|nr:cupredoxin domain-containing protein [Alphaproteobacteria bacterium]
MASRLRLSLGIALSALPLLAAATAQAEEIVTYETTLKDATFSVAEIKVPAGKPFIIKLNNANAAAAELEAKDLKIEKIVAGNSSIVVRVKAMEAGKYLFVDEYQESIAKGYIIVE